MNSLVAVANLKHLTELRLKYFKHDLDEAQFPVFYVPHSQVRVLTLHYFKLPKSDLNGTKFFRIFSRFFPSIEELNIFYFDDYAEDNDYPAKLNCILDVNLGMFPNLRKYRIKCSHGLKFH